MRKLIESAHVALRGQIDPLDWAFPYLDDEHARYATDLLTGAGALLLGRRTYEGLSASYPAIIGGDVAGFVAGLKREPGGTIVKSGQVSTCSRRSAAPRS